jgi:hypothetical protein
MLCQCACACRGDSELTHIIVGVFGEESKELFQKLDHLIRGFLDLMNITVRINIAEASSHGLIDKEQIRKFRPRAVVVRQIAFWRDPVGTNLHHCAIHRTASRTSIEPQDCALLVCNVAVLVVPEEEVAVVFGRDLDMSARDACQRVFVQKELETHPACILSRGSGAPGNDEM